MKGLILLLFITVLFTCQEKTTIIYDRPFVLEINEAAVDTGRVVGLVNEFNLGHIISFKALEHETVSELPVYAQMMGEILEVEGRGWMKVLTIEKDTIVLQTKEGFEIKGDYQGKKAIFDVESSLKTKDNPFKISQKVHLSLINMFVMSSN